MLLVLGRQFFFFGGGDNFLTQFYKLGSALVTIDWATSEIRRWKKDMSTWAANENGCAHHNWCAALAVARGNVVVHVLTTTLYSYTARHSSVETFAGLSIVFNTDQDAYAGDLTQGAGIRVIVHSQSEMPFPEDQSIAVSPGMLTYIGASLVHIALVRRLTN